MNIEYKRCLYSRVYRYTVVSYCWNTNQIGSFRCSNPGIPVPAGTSLDTCHRASCERKVVTRVADVMPTTAYIQQYCCSLLVPGTTNDCCLFYSCCCNWKLFSRSPAERARPDDHIVPGIIQILYHHTGLPVNATEYHHILVSYTIDSIIHPEYTNIPGSRYSLCS